MEVLTLTLTDHQRRKLAERHIPDPAALLSGLLLACC